MFARIPLWCYLTWSESFQSRKYSPALCVQEAWGVPELQRAGGCRSLQPDVTFITCENTQRHILQYTMGRKFILKRLQRQWGKLWSSGCHICTESLARLSKRQDWNMSEGCLAPMSGRWNKKLGKNKELYKKWQTECSFVYHEPHLERPWSSKWVVRCRQLQGIQPKELWSFIT
jgi:hypothetical protein